jgi:hypothetical protein
VFELIWRCDLIWRARLGPIDIEKRSIQEALPPLGDFMVRIFVGEESRVYGRSLRRCKLLRLCPRVTDLCPTERTGVIVKPKLSRTATCQCLMLQCKIMFM